MGYCWENDRERTEQLKAFMLRMPIADAQMQALKKLRNAGLGTAIALELAVAFDQSFNWYWRAEQGERFRAQQEDLASELHGLAKQALRHLDRKKPPPASTIDELVKKLKVLNTLKSPRANAYVSPVMRFGITDQTVRMATGQRPLRCRQLRCGNRSQPDFCRCMIWPEGEASTIDPFADFDYPRVPLQSILDPRVYGWSGAAGLWRLYAARFDPKARTKKRGPPEPAFDQDLIDDLCSVYEDISGKPARHDTTSWTATQSAMLEVYGLEFLGYTENRIKRWEQHRDYQRKTYGVVCLPRGVDDPAPNIPRKGGRVLTKSVGRREKILKSQLAKLQLENELFVGGT